MTSGEAAPDFAEIRRLITDLPGPDLAAAAAVEERLARLAKPRRSLGRLEEALVWLATWQGRVQPTLDRPHTAIFAASHGVANQAVSARSFRRTEQMVQNVIAGGAAVNQLCGLADAGLQVYEMALEEPTADFTSAPAMSEADCAKAMAYGMMAVEGDLDILALGDMGVGNTASAAAIAQALHGGRPEDWIAPSPGVEPATLQHRTDVLAAAAAFHRFDPNRPLEVLRCLGGREIAAIAGAILAARMARIPVLLDGFAATAAAAVLQALDRRAIDHCLIGDLSAEPGQALLARKLEQRPLLELDLFLGEAAGAVLALFLLRGVLACHDGMATAAEAGLADRES